MSIQQNNYNRLTLDAYELPQTQVFCQVYSIGHIFPLWVRIYNQSENVDSSYNIYTSIIPMGISCHTSHNFNLFYSQLGKYIHDLFFPSAYITFYVIMKSSQQGRNLAFPCLVPKYKLFMNKLLMVNFNSQPTALEIVFIIREYVEKGMEVQGSYRKQISNTKECLKQPY